MCLIPRFCREISNSQGFAFRIIYIDLLHGDQARGGRVLVSPVTPVLSVAQNSVAHDASRESRGICGSANVFCVTAPELALGMK